jgi:hypothetical protein
VGRLPLEVSAQEELRRVRRLGRRGDGIQHGGKLTALLRIVGKHEGALEADLSQHHHLRYTDRWRRDQAGVPLLTLREIWVRIQELPPTARLVVLGNGGRPRWTDADYLLADIAGILAGREHPARPKPNSTPTQRVDSRRAALRQRRIKAKREREAQRAQKGGGQDG